MSRAISLPVYALLFLGTLQTALAAPKNVLLARDRTEPVVAVDPRDPATIIAGSNTNYDQSVDGGYPVGYFSSHDGGRSFQFGPVPFIQPYSVGADPTVAFAKSGTAFFSYLGEAPNYCGGGAGGVMLTTSTDGGRSFRSPTIVDPNSADDKPNMAVESVPGQRAHVFLTWTRWYNSSSEIWLARSTNGGDSFSAPVRLYASGLNNFGSVPAVAPRGQVYVFWSNFGNSASSAVTPTRIMMRVSFNDGRSFGPPRTVVPTFLAIPHMALPGSLRILTQPAVAINPSGRIFLAYSVVTGRLPGGAVDTDIDLMSSADGGRAWTAPRPINDVHTGDRFMPAMTILPDGSLGVAFYDRREGWWDLGVYAVRVDVNGPNLHISRNVRVNHVTSPIGDIYYIKPRSTCFSPGRFFGDYIGTAAAPGGRLCVVWADTQLHVYQRTDVWFAKVRLPVASFAVRRVVHRDVAPALWDRIGLAIRAVRIGAWRAMLSGLQGVLAAL